MMDIPDGIAPQTEGRVTAFNTADNDGGGRNLAGDSVLLLLRLSRTCCATPPKLRAGLPLRISGKILGPKKFSGAAVGRTKSTTSELLVF